MEPASSNFETIVKDIRDKVISAKDPNETLGTARANVRLLGQQYQEVKLKEFTIASDEPISVGGTNKAPTPLDYFVASIGFCENIMFTRHASLHGLIFDSLETSVHGHWDRRGQYEIEGTDASFKEMTVETKVTTKAPVERVIEVTRITHKTCPMRATIGKAMKVTDKLFVNGQEIRL